MKKICTLLLLLLLISLTSCIDNLELIKEKPYDNTDNSIIQANISNWGYAVSDGKNIYYSDWKQGIFKYNSEEETEPIVSGNYSDMGIINNTLYCVETTSEYEFDKTTIVGIDLKSLEKKVIYESPTSVNSLIYGSNVINEKYYFIVDDDCLFSVDKYGKIKDTPIRSARLITPDGVYTTQSSNRGLKLVSMDGNTIKTYPEVSELEVWVKFELGKYLYLTSYENDTHQIYRLNKNTGKLTLFPDDENFYSNSSYVSINFYEDLFYISVTSCDESGNVIHKIYSIDKEENVVEIMRTENDNGSWLCTMNIADNYMFICYPWSMLEPDVIDFNN